jgi:hypothetical protein
VRAWAELEDGPHGGGERLGRFAVAATDADVRVAELREERRRRQTFFTWS